MPPSETPPFWDVTDWDDALEQDETCQLVVAEAWVDVRLWQRSCAKQIIVNVDRIVSWHKSLFEGLFPTFAGRVRSPQYPIEVNFGPYNGSGHAYVEAELKQFELRLLGLIGQLDDFFQTRPNASRHEFLVEVVRAAAWCHADFVRIHPFRNGNGRVGRLIIDYFAFRYDLKPIGINKPSIPEYFGGLDYYMRHRDSSVFYKYLERVMLHP